LNKTGTGRSYIVVFKDTTAAHVIEKAEKDILELGGKIGQRYNTVLKGFSAWMPGHIYTALSTNPFIDYIEEDGEGKRKGFQKRRLRFFFLTALIFLSFWTK